MEVSTLMRARRPSVKRHRRQVGPGGNSSFVGSCGKAFNKYYSGYRESGIKTDKVLAQYIREKIDI